MPSIDQSREARDPESGSLRAELERLRSELQAATAAQAALAATAERYKRLFALAADAILLGDPGGNLIDANDSALLLTGYPREELLGMNIAGLFSAAERERAPLRYDLLREGRVVLTERLLLRKDGTTVAVSMHSKMMPDGNYHAFIRDITERKSAEKSLQEREAMLSSVLRAAPIGIGTTSQRILTWLSEPLLAMLGYAYEELVGRSARILYENEEEFQRVGQVKYQQIEAKNVGVVETRWLRRNGTCFDVLLSSTLLNSPDPAGGVTFTVTDITERKKFEAKEREIAEMKREFIATASHELRTPLAVCQGYLEMLLEHEDFSDEQRREFLGIAYDRTLVLTRLIDELLDVDKIESGGKISLDRRPVNIAQLAGTVASGFGLTSKAHQILLDFADNNIEVSVDEDKLTQVFENLLNNAIKFSPGGGVITVRGELAGDCYRLSVTDAGIGVHPEYYERIFDKFFRIDSTNTAAKGLGLGLFLVKSIVAAHGGTVRVASRPGEGSTFIVSLPMHPDPD